VCVCGVCGCGCGVCVVCVCVVCVCVVCVVCVCGVSVCVVCVCGVFVVCVCVHFVIRHRKRHTCAPTTHPFLGRVSRLPLCLKLSLKGCLIEMFQ